ncbi:hypothetical protein KM043_005249 [Ampulex compressa]|nr:hypothetical protein KM043_005249 [Ampulex compressa]
MAPRKKIVKTKKRNEKLFGDEDKADVVQRSNVVSECGDNAKAMVASDNANSILEKKSVFKQSSNINTMQIRVKNLEILKNQTVNDITNDRSNSVHSHSTQKRIRLSKNIEALLSSPLKISKEGDRVKIEICNQETQYVTNIPQETQFGTNAPHVTPSKRKKRKLSDLSDYEQLCDNIKPELYDHEHFNDLEPIQLLHDLDTAINFADTKISSDILLFSTAYDNIDEDAEEDNFKMCKDPPVDPLFIGSSDEQSANTKTIEMPRMCLRSATLKKRQSKVKKPAKYTAKKNIKSIKSIATKQIRYSSLRKKICLNEEKYVGNGSEESNMEESDMEIQSKHYTDRLKDLYINLMHDVPLQHKIESSGGSKTPTQTEKIMFQKYGPLKKGTYSLSEDDIIRRNWETFCKLHDWDPKEVQPFLYMRHNGKYYIKNIKERFRNLYETRPRHFGRNSSIRYSQEEDLKILSYIENHSTDKNVQNNKCSHLAKLLGRTRHSVWLRYQKLKNNINIEKNDNTSAKNTERRKEAQLLVSWDILKIQKFIKALLRITLSEDIQELKDARLPKPIWEKMEEDLNIDQNVLKTFWLHQLHMQLFCTRSIYLNDIKIELIEYMYGKGISSTREIIWPNVANYFDGVTTIFLCKIFFDLVKDCTRKTSIREFSDIIEYLHQNKIPEIKSEKTDKFLPRIAYREGKISIIDTDVNDYVEQ